jgi:hypothetical protein
MAHVYVLEYLLEYVHVLGTLPKTTGHTHYLWYLVEVWRHTAIHIRHVVLEYVHVYHGYADNAH